MTFGNLDWFEMSGLIFISGELLALAISCVLVRHFNKKIREARRQHYQTHLTG